MHLRAIPTVEIRQLKTELEFNRHDCIALDGFSYDIHKLRDQVSKFKHESGLTKKLELGHSTSWSILDVSRDSMLGADDLEYNHSPKLNEFIVPTVFCQGPMVDMIWDLRLQGLRLARARVISLHECSRMSFHCDEILNSNNSWRIHIPIVTNELSTLDWISSPAEENIRSYHLKADGTIYFVKVNQLHRARNDSFDFKRIHFVASLLI